MKHPDDDLAAFACVALCIGVFCLTAIPLHAIEANGVHIPKDKEINFTYTFIVPDTGSMRPVLWDGDTVRVWHPTVRPWVWGNGLVGKMVIRKNCPWSSTNTVCHFILAVTPRGAITGGINNGELGSGPCYDPGFMAKNGEDYAGECEVLIHQAHPPKQKLHQWQKQ